MNTSQVPSTYNVQETMSRDEIQRGFITRVYGWMTIGLLITATAALFTISTPGLLTAIVSNQFVFLGLLLGEVVLVFALSLAANRISPQVAGILFTGYAVLNGVTFSVLFLVYTQSSIALTFGVTACTFGIMTLLGFTTHRDLTRLGSLLIMGLIGLILASLVNFFINNSAVYWITTYLGILIFVGLVAYDTQRLKNMSLTLSEDGQLTQNKSIIGALTLYLDFINLFLLLLRVLGKRNNS